MSNYTVAKLLGRPGAELDQTQRDALLAAGFMVLPDFDVVRSEPLLSTLVPLTERQSTVLAVRQTMHLSDFRQLKAIQAWQVLGDTSNGKTFLAVCELMEHANISFADMAPAKLDCRTSDDWMQYGLDRVVANILLHSSVIGPQILVELTKEDLNRVSATSDLGGLGPKRRKTITELMGRLHTQVTADTRLRASTPESAEPVQCEPGKSIKIIIHWLRPDQTERP